MSKQVRIKHLTEPNITTFVNGKQITIRNHETTVNIEDAKVMMEGPWGYELVGIYDDFLDYVNKIETNIKSYIRQSAPFFRVLIATPLAGHKLYSWEKFTDRILKLENLKDVDLLFTLDTPDTTWGEQVKSWCHKNRKKIGGYHVIEWNYDKIMAWNRVFKITVARQLIFNFAREYSAYSHVFFVDSDILLPSSALVKLLGHSRDHTAGLYYFKFISNGGPVVFNLYGKDTWPPAGQGAMKTDVVPNSGMIESDWTGAGCLLLSRKIFTECSFNWSKWIQRHGEDAYICLAARKLTGQKLLVDTSVFCKHLDENDTEWPQNYNDTSKN